ncbi:MAG: redoxin domain-containing protein [Solirubrobacterales bacterium]|nr:redoxin domain-containing protein [Solirubrobacterales bacterium]
MSKQRRSMVVLAVATMVVAAGVGAALALVTGRNSSSASATNNPVLDPGTPISGRAVNFTLTDQFGRSVSLSDFRGKVVILAFNDPVCTTVCPLTTTAMLEAKALLGNAASRVELLGVGANPTATAVKWVRDYSRVHGMTDKWHFLTGALPELKRVWKTYGIEARVVHGLIDHTPALYVITPRGTLSRLYLTQMSYASVDQLGQELAQNASRLLPGHPAVPSVTTYNQIPAIDPGTPVRLPRAGGGSVRLGPGDESRLVLFFDTWDSEVTNLGARLDSLDRYQRAAARGRLPALVAVDEGSVEPSASALPRFLRRLPHPLSYPVATDRSGRVGDGYRVQDEPWLELLSPAGEFLWYRDLSTAGWPTSGALVKQVRYALAHAPKPNLQSDTGGQLAGSPTALQALHAQAGQLLSSALDARLRALHGYPIVINAWASWCTPCQQEFGLFASASLRYGRKVAFLGADTDDSAGSARTFLKHHPVSYPSYETTIAALGSLASVEGLPTTIFINRAGKVVDVHTGQYTSQSTLDGDIQSYSLGR